MGSRGDVAFSCAAPTPPKQSTVFTAAATKAVPQQTRASVPIASPPAYHSKTGASNVTYLDFNGWLMSGTAFNDDYNGGADYDTYAFSLDGDYTMFSDAEQAIIRQTWERITEDYAPFNVDITTEEPAAFTPTTGRILFTRDEDKSANPMPSAGSGGFAYISVFGDNNYPTYSSPALVYYENHFGQYDLLADTGSHEMGHNLGLSHDGAGLDEYYGDHGSGEIEWSPLMGLSARAAVTHWSKGEYFTGNQLQDDLAILSGELGYRTDDHGDTTRAASPLSISESGALLVSDNNRGIIERNTDTDIFSLSSGVGEISLHVAPLLNTNGALAGNLDIEA